LKIVKTMAPITKSTARQLLNFTTNLFKNPGDRLALVKEIPSLIAARDKAGHGRKTETTPERNGPRWACSAGPCLHLTISKKCQAPTVSIGSM
jgi:hypothetical protein